MPVESAADRAVFFDTDDFGVVAAIQKLPAAAYNVDGIFDAAYQVVLAGLDGEGIESAAPVFTCASDDLANPAIDDLVTVAAVNYRVRNVQPDGTGVTKLILEEI